MDILTEKGQQSALDELDAINIFLDKYPSYEYIHTDKRRESAVDGFITKNGVIYAAVETKCRYNLTVDKFMNEYDGTWLITFDKLVLARNVSINLCTPLIGFLYLVEEKTLLFKKLIDEYGEFVCDEMAIKNTRTQKTINDKNKIARNNAFINMKNAKVICATQP
jgi:hypothetical protein